MTNSKTDKTISVIGGNLSEDTPPETLLQIAERAIDGMVTVTTYKTSMWPAIIDYHFTETYIYAGDSLICTKSELTYTERETVLTNALGSELLKEIDSALIGYFKDKAKAEETNDG